MIERKQPAPPFTLLDDQGKEVSLKDFEGKKVVLYFYPKDDTPGCTTEACGFRDIHDEILDRGAVILGVSPDPQKKHEKFRQKYNLPFHLLSDPEHTVLEAYNAWGEKKMYGKTYMGVLRSTVLIDESGNIQEIYPKVKPADHPREILEALEA